MRPDRRHLWLAGLLVLASFGVASSQGAQVGQHESETWDYSPFPAPDNGYVTDVDGLLRATRNKRGSRCGSGKQKAVPESRSRW